MVSPIYNMALESNAEQLATMRDVAEELRWTARVADAQRHISGEYLRYLADRLVGSEDA